MKLTTDFLLLRSYGNESALSRVQSDPLFDGLAALGEATHRCIYTAGETVSVPHPKFTVVHHDDTNAILMAKELRQSHGSKVVCLAADIYEIERYVAISEVADIFVAPTPLHQQVLQSALWREVFLVPEGIDSICLAAGGHDIPVRENQRLCWFGYPESFVKATRYILPKAIEMSGMPLADFCLITAKDAMLIEGATHRVFDPETFYAVTADHGFTLLSHFAYDLHLNSYIKSPNKLITSIVRGMVPLVSNTRSYGELMNEYELNRLAYSSGYQLAGLLGNLDAIRDRHRARLALAAAALRERYSAVNVARAFLNCIG